MQQLNVYGCREYLVSVASNQSFQILSIVIIRAPFNHFKDREPNTLGSICTTSDSLCMMAPFTYSSVYLQNKQQTSSPKFFGRRHSAISNHYQGLLGECGFESEYSTTIQICKDPVQKQRTKHIEIHMHYIRQLVHNGTIHLLVCSSSEQVVDIFTKVFL